LNISLLLVEVAVVLDLAVAAVLVVTELGHWR